MAAAGGSGDMATQGAQLLQSMKDVALNMASREKKDEDEVYSPFQNLQKSQVLQDCRCFNDREINPRRCTNILTKMLWLLSQGEKLTQLETTEVFFGVTKLLQVPVARAVTSRPLPCSLKSILLTTALPDRCAGEGPAAAPAHLFGDEGAEAQPRGGAAASPALPKHAARPEP